MIKLSPRGLGEVLQWTLSGPNSAKHLTLCLKLMTSVSALLSQSFHFNVRLSELYGKYITLFVQDSISPTSSPSGGPADQIFYLFSPSSWFSISSWILFACLFINFHLDYRFLVFNSPSSMLQFLCLGWHTEDCIGRASVAVGVFLGPACKLEGPVTKHVS